MAKQKQNRYRSAADCVLGDHRAMEKLYKPKVVLVNQVLKLSAHVLAETFGCVGKHYIEAVRDELVYEIAASTVPLCSWREAAARLKGRDEAGTLNVM